MSGSSPTRRRASPEPPWPSCRRTRGRSSSTRARPRSGSPNCSPTDRALTVVTNAVNLLETLSVRSNLTVQFLGGRLRPRTLATVDAWALEALEQTYVDVAFVATNGFSLERGLTTSDVNEAAVKRAAIGSARRTVLLADHTKVGNDHFQRFAEPSDVDTFITDTGLDADLAREIEDAGITVLLA